MGWSVFVLSTWLYVEEWSGVFLWNVINGGSTSLLLSEDDDNDDTDDTDALVLRWCK